MALKQTNLQEAEVFKFLQLLHLDLQKEDTFAGCEGIQVTQQGLQCQLDQDALSGEYRVLVWHPVVGFAVHMPLLSVTPVFSEISPLTSKHIQFYQASRKVNYKHNLKALFRARHINKVTSSYSAAHRDEIVMLLDGQMCLVVEPNHPYSVGPLGGTLLNILGNGFANASIAVTVAQQPCVIRLKTNTEVICRTPAFPTEQSSEIQV